MARRRLPCGRGWGEGGRGRGAGNFGAAPLRYSPLHDLSIPPPFPPPPALCSIAAHRRRAHAGRADVDAPLGVAVGSADLDELSAEAEPALPLPTPAGSQAGGCLPPLPNTMDPEQGLSAMLDTDVQGLDS